MKQMCFRKILDSSHTATLRRLELGHVTTPSAKEVTPQASLNTGDSTKVRMDSEMES